MASEPSAVARGSAAESIAAAFLSQRGYKILRRNYRAPGGEIDLIAWDGETLCFIEVRARQTVDFGDPLETIDRRKVSRVVRAARHYLDALEPPWPAMRFDAVGIVLNPLHIELVRDAFEA